jgi:hypothetical protein
MGQNGTGKKAWSLARDGMLWKTVLDYTNKEFQEHAQAFVAQLQESVQPTDALQGLLLDRIAAGYLRKQVMLVSEAASREYAKAHRAQEPQGSTPHMQKVSLIAFGNPLQYPWFGSMVRYEALLAVRGESLDSHSQ